MIRLTPSDLTGSVHDGLLDAVHDRWFDLEAVRYQPDAGEFALRFGDRKTGPFDHELRIHGVADYRVDDRAHIQVYDLNEIVFDQEKRRILLRSAFPLEIALSVSEDWELLCDT
jgi:hypothetical protein